MTERDLLFLVLIVISATTLTLVIWQLVRWRRRGSDSDQPSNWWEGPWDEDRKS